MVRDDAFSANYYLPYEEGVLPEEIINSQRWFERVTLYAIQEYDETHLTYIFE